MLRLPIKNNYLYCGLQFSVPFAALYHTGDGDAASASTRASAAYFTMGPAADNGALEYRPEKLSPAMTRKAHIIAGIIIGLCFTIVGVSTVAPGRLYNLHGNWAYIMIPIGTASHMLIWGVIVYWVNGLLGVRSRA